MKTSTILRISAILAFASTLVACGDNTPALPDCPDSTVFAPCLIGSNATPTGFATCWNGAPIDTATPVVGCILPHDTAFDECVAACPAQDSQSWKANP